MTHEGRWIASFLERPAGLKDRSLSDLEVLRRRKDVRILPLQGQAQSILEELPALGSADYTTGNGAASCTRRERVTDIRRWPEGTAIFGDQGGLRWLDQSWRHAVAVLNRGEDFTDTPPCLLFYGETGHLAHQVTLWDPGAWEGFIDLVCRNRSCWECFQIGVDPPACPETGACPPWLLKEAWRDAGSEWDLGLRLEPLGLKRVTALRAMEGLFTTLIERHHFASLIEGIAESGFSLHVQLGNRHCTQVLEAPIEGFEAGGREWEIRTAQTVLTLCPSKIASIWLVARPPMQVERLRVECYGADGEQVLAFSGPGGSCPLVPQDGQGSSGASKPDDSTDAAVREELHFHPTKEMP